MRDLAVGATAFGLLAVLLHTSRAIARRRGLLPASSRRLPVAVALAFAALTVLLVELGSHPWWYNYPPTATVG
ncbi:hypothetical protein [Actinocatenispora rupis]|uniref:Uncharacterized protein n=1 Tax=Actinocatenispora rupis TaxID=519421 RepID=A0A8J3J6A0_9ACTN|nr:hypothetical protein [Actinocatenispora rupis]GID10168.1 hypothetical protein Aru02nite_10570 [Actinocatenispora rupis]